MDSVSQRDRYPLGRDVSDSIRSVPSQMLSSLNCYWQEYQARCPALALENAPRIHLASPNSNHQRNEDSRARNRNRVCIYSSILSSPFFNAFHYSIVLTGAEQSLDPGRCKMPTINGWALRLRHLQLPISTTKVLASKCYNGNTGFLDRSTSPACGAVWCCSFADVGE
jgi:hypothetical protein